MSQNSVTLKELVTAVRELTFDRFIIPAFALKENAGFVVSVTPMGSEAGVTTGALIYKNVESKEEKVFPYLEYPTMGEMMTALIEAEIVVAYTPYFRDAEPSHTLIKVTDKSLEEDITLFRRYFFSDEEIAETIKWYYYKVLDIIDVPLTDEVIARLQRPSERHLAIWVAYQLVEKRRLYESAAGAIGQSFTDGSDYTGTSEASMGAGTTTTVQIGSVFSITEDPKAGYFYEDFNRVGSDNILGDRYSFWYKLQLYLRDLLETQFGDYQLRKDNVIPGYITLTRELDFRSYFDSYPFTMSPLSRGIVSKTP